MNSKAPALMVATIVIFAATILICLLAFVPNRRGETNETSAPSSDLPLTRSTDGLGGHTTMPWQSPAPAGTSPIQPPEGSNH